MKKKKHQGYLRHLLSYMLANAWIAFVFYLLPELISSKHQHPIALWLYVACIVVLALYNAAANMGKSLMEEAKDDLIDAQYSANTAAKEYIAVLEEQVSAYKDHVARLEAREHEASLSHGNAGKSGRN